MAAHRLTDWNAVGAHGSEAARLARGLLEDTGFKIVYRQVEASLELTRDLLGLTDVQTALLRYLRKGSGMWLLGQRAFVVQHLLSSIEEPWVQTDSRMRATTGAHDNGRDTSGDISGDIANDISEDEWEALLDEPGVS
jgi:hypothetical protein